MNDKQLDQLLRSAARIEYEFWKNDPDFDKQQLEDLRKRAGLINQAEFQNEQFEAAKRSMWDRGMTGIRFQPPFTVKVEDKKLLEKLGAHNTSAKIVKDEDGSMRGLYNCCQCDECLTAQGVFVVSTCAGRVAIVGQAAGSYSVIPDPDGERATCLRRSTSQLEQDTDTRRITEAAERMRRELIRETDRQFIASGAMNL